MTNEEINVAIAVVHGWKDCGFYTNPLTDAEYDWLSGISPEVGCRQSIPNFCADDAIQKMVASLRPEIANRWAEELVKVVSFEANPYWSPAYHLGNATNRERAEAFLRMVDAIVKGDASPELYQKLQSKE